MAVIGRKTGLPKALEGEEAETPKTKVQTPEEFAREFFGEADKPQSDMPPLAWLKEQYKTKSAAIRYLVNLGYAVKDISKHMDIKYQMVRNVAKNPLKRGPNEDWRPKDQRVPPSHRNPINLNGDNDDGDWS